jgi:hypothetical protein
MVVVESDCRQVFATVRERGVAVFYGVRKEMSSTRVEDKLDEVAVL